MITDRQRDLMVEEYYNRGVIKKEIRSYEVSLWTLQDSFITVLKWSDVEQKGRIEQPKLKLNIDGTQEFTFTIPMYIYQNGALIENPNWYNTRNGNILVSMRKVKIIFNKSTPEEGIFELLITDVKESHEKDIATCELTCEGLAFHELGKIGYTYNLSQELFELDYQEWEKTRIGEEPAQTLDYWCKKINLLKYPSNASEIQSGAWYYRVEMSYSAFSGADGLRDSTKVYEEAYTEAWTAELRPRRTQSYREKARPISVEKSNIYNITQTIAEKFNIFCRYEYGYDENYHIISRCIVFYNSFLEEEKGLLTFMYPHSSSKIMREMDASNLTTKLFVSDVDDDSIYSGYHSIMNVEANPTKENYILNFDYMLKIGTISQEQYDSIQPFNILMAQYNGELAQKQANLVAYQEKQPELEAKIAVAEKTLTTAQEQISQDNRLKNALDASDGAADGYITIGNTNPEQKIIITGGGGAYIRLDDTNKGIDVSSLRVYKNYDSGNQRLTNEIAGIQPEYEDTYGQVYRIKVPPQAGSQIVYLTYRYNPVLYYDKIIKVWEEKIGNTNRDLTKLKDELGEKNPVTGVGTSGLYKTIDDTTNRINELLTLKSEAIRKFERMMGPALREGYWQPEDYTDYGEQKEASAQLKMTDPAIIMTAGTNDGMAVGWETELFDGEQDIFYYQGLTEEKVYYPCINLTSIYDTIRNNINDYSFIFNSNYYDSNVNLNDIKNLQVYKIGSQALIRYITQGNAIYPALVLIGAKNLTADELTFMKDGTKGRPRIGKITTTINEGTGTVSTVITNAIYVSDSRFWTFNGIQVGDSTKIVYPRVKFSSLALKTDTTNFVLRYGDTLLNQFEDYRFNTRTVEREGNFYPEYFVTIKPETIFKIGHLLDVQANYIISNADTSIYLDALDVSKENAFPKVSYEITPNILNPQLSHILYQKLAQVVMINDVELKFENTFGYISEIELDLDNVSEDTVTVQNYKTKFEDLFSNIIAQTEEMKHAATAIDAAVTGAIPLGNQAFSATLVANSTALNNYLDAYFDNSQVVLDKLTGLFTEAGKILAASNNTLNSMHALTLDNANILGSFATDVSSELSTNVYRSETKPDSYKFGDIWIQTDSEGNEIGRYMATSTGTANSDPTAGFVRTWDGTLAQIYGAALNVDADQGIIDIIARNYLNLRAGDVYIAANRRVDIVGNESVNIGGAELNFCSLNEEDVNGPTGNIIPTKGINLIAGTYSQKDEDSISKVLISPTKIEFGSSDVLMKASSSITLLSSTGVGANTAAVSIDANKGIWLGSGTGVHIYSGTASDHIYIGPKHKAKFQAGDIWVKITRIGAGGHDTYDGDPGITDASKRQYYTNYIQSDSDYSTLFTIDGKYIAAVSWDEQYDADEAAALQGMDSLDGWTQDDTILDESDILNVKGASVEINDEHLMFGFSNVQNNTSNSAAVEITDDYVLIAAGDTLQTMRDRTVTGMSNSLVGAKFTKDSIGMAVGSNNDIAAMIMNYNGLTFGHGLGSINIGTATAEQLRLGVESTGGSYVRIAHNGIELGSTATLYINTNNFKLQTVSLDPLNSEYEMGNTMLAIGNKLNSITAATTPAQIAAVDDTDGIDVRMVVNRYGLYIKGDVYATNGSFNGDVTARTLNAIGGKAADGTGFVFSVDGNYLGMFKITEPNGQLSDPSTEKLLYFDSETDSLWITGTLKIGSIFINENNTTQDWETYFSNMPLDYMDTVDDKVTELFDSAGQIISLAISSTKDMTALNEITESRLASFKTDVVGILRPNVSSGASHPALFKKGDIWNRTGAAGAASFIATRSWDEIYTSEALASTSEAIASTDGWNRVSAEGVLADVRGASLTVDTVSGDIVVLAENNINVRAKANINMLGNNIEITATKVNDEGGNLNLSGDTSVNIASGGGIYLVTSNVYTGTKAVSIDQHGIDLASNSDINLRAGGHIYIYSASEEDASAFKISKDDGIWVGTTQKIDFAATDGANAGSILQLNKDRIIMGVTTSTNTGAVDITPEQIIFAVANAATGMENMNIALDGSASGVQIKRDYIALATGNVNRRSLISIAPERIFIGTAAKTTIADSTNIEAMKTKIINNESTGAYIDIRNDTSVNYPTFEVGSTAQFTILTPTFTIDNIAQGTTNMLYIADNAAWANASTGMRFSQTNGLEIKANKVTVAASNIQLTTSATLQSTLDEAIQQTIRWYTTTANDTAPIVPSGWSNNDLGAGWSKTIKFGTNGGDGYVWSTTQYIRGDGQKSYDAPMSEGRLADLSDITYKVYKRTSSSTVPAATSTGWTTQIPQASYTINSGAVTDRSTGSSIAHDTTTITLPYLWSVEVTEHLNGTKTYGTVTRELMLEDGATGAKVVDDIINGRTAVPYVKSSGLTIDGNYVALTSSGTLALLGNSKLLIGVSNAGAVESSSTISLTSSGININSGGNININGGTFTVASGNGFSIDSTGAVSMTSATVGGWTVANGQIKRTYSADSTDYTAYLHHNTGDTYSPYAIYINNGKFKVDYKGNCWIQALYVSDTFIDFTRAFDQAVSLTSTWDGANTVTSKVVAWGVLNKTATSSVSWGNFQGFIFPGFGSPYDTTVGTVITFDLSIAGNTVGKTIQGMTLDISGSTKSAYENGYQAAANAVTYASGGNSVTVPSGKNSTESLDITATFNAGWNACLAACTAVNDAYHAGTQTTWSDSGTVRCSQGHSANWSTSHSYTPQGSSYSGLYTLPGAK